MANWNARRLGLLPTHEIHNPLIKCRPAGTETPPVRGVFGEEVGLKTFDHCPQGEQDEPNDHEE